VFVDIVTELETCHIYKTVLLTIKVVAHDAYKARNATKHLTSKAIHNIIQQN
jgi:hypothetical protein